MIPIVVPTILAALIFGWWYRSSNRRAYYAIVGKYGGLCIECGPIPEDYVPFANLFDRR
jgi:hypothetical protein